MRSLMVVEVEIGAQPGLQLTDRVILVEIDAGQLHLNWVEKRLDDVEETI